VTLAPRHRLPLRIVRSARAGQHDGAPRAGEGDGLGEGGRCLGGDVDDDVGQPAARLAQGGHGVAGRNVDGEVGAPEQKAWIRLRLREVHRRPRRAETLRSVRLLGQ